MKSTTVAAKEAVSKLAAQQEAEIITQDSTTGSGQDHQRKGKAVCCPSKNGGNEQHTLAGKGNARTLDSDKDEDSPIAIGGEQMEKIMWMKRDHHIVLPFLPSQKAIFA